MNRGTTNENRGTTSTFDLVGEVRQSSEVVNKEFVDDVENKENNDKSQKEKNERFELDQQQ